MIDADAVLWSEPPERRSGRPLLVLLHGYGANEHDLFSFAEHLPQHPVVASVRALHPAGPGFAWFPLLAGTPLSEVIAAADSAADALLDWLAGTGAERVGVIGFSQGGAMGLQLLRRRPDLIDVVVNLAGFTLPQQLPGDERLRAERPPVFWGRGLADAVIPASAIDVTQQWLPRHSTLVSRTYPGLGHSVSQQELQDVLAFLGEHY